MFEIIRQSESNTCMACVMAMLVHESEQYVLEWFEYIDPPFHDEDMVIFLAHHGIFLSMGFDLSNINALTKEELTDINININLDGRPAYMSVKSRTEGIYHAVLWDGYMILDPLYDDPQPLENYVVDVVYPMMITKIRYEKLMEGKNDSRS